MSHFEQALALPAFCSSESNTSEDEEDVRVDPKQKKPKKKIVANNKASAKTTKHVQQPKTSLGTGIKFSFV